VPDPLGPDVGQITGVLDDDAVHAAVDQGERLLHAVLVDVLDGFTAVVRCAGKWRKVDVSEQRLLALEQLSEPVRAVR